MLNQLSNVSEKEIVTFYAKVSSNVSRIRQEKNISQMDLALDIGIKSVAFFSNAENNKYNKHFNLEHLYKIAKALDIDICELIQ